MCSLLLLEQRQLLLEMLTIIDLAVFQPKMHYLSFGRGCNAAVVFSLIGSTHTRVVLVSPRGTTANKSRCLAKAVTADRLAGEGSHERSGPKGKELLRSMIDKMRCEHTADSGGGKRHVTVEYDVVCTGQLMDSESAQQWRNRHLLGL